MIRITVLTVLIVIIALVAIVKSLLEPKMFVEQTDMWGRLTAVERGARFERWCAELLKRNGFWAVRICGKSGDQGVDIVAWRWLRKYAIQCKCYTRPLGSGPVQEINTGMEVYNASVGVVMTNSNFTKGARETAKEAGKDKPILLWDRSVLEKMCK